MRARTGPRASSKAESKAVAVPTLTGSGIDQCSVAGTDSSSWTRSQTVMSRSSPLGKVRDIHVNFSFVRCSEGVDDRNARTASISPEDEAPKMRPVIPGNEPEETTPPGPGLGGPCGDRMMLFDCPAGDG
jgi:hypothetical protein